MCITYHFLSVVSISQKPNPFEGLERWPGPDVVEMKHYYFVNPVIFLEMAHIYKACGVPYLRAGGTAWFFLPSVRALLPLEATLRITLHAEQSRIMPC